LTKTCESFFSNFTVKQFGKGKRQRCDADYELKEPWQGLLEDNNFDHGRGEKLKDIASELAPSFIRKREYLRCFLLLHSLRRTFDYFAKAKVGEPSTLQPDP